MDNESIKYSDGSRYEGEVRDGKRQGQGTWIRPDGVQYTGHWNNDKPDGQGTITWPDGKKYAGQWSQGKRHGKGTEILPDGSRIEGEWENGEFVREIVADSEEGFDLDHTEIQGPGPWPGTENSTTRGPAFSSQTGPGAERKTRSFTPREPSRERDLSDDYDYTEDLQEAGKGFFAALFDVSMKEMVTPKIIRVLYLVGLIVIGIGVLVSIVTSLIAAFNNGFIALLITIIAVPVGAIIAVIFFRIYMELIILLFNIYDLLKDIKQNLAR